MTQQNVVLELNFNMNKITSEKTISPDRFLSFRFMNELESVTSGIGFNLNN